jgi:TetR/AcrR family transcriptional repressor of nem operon
MPRPRGFTEKTVLEAVKQTFWDRGYEGTGLDELQSATGLSRSSLYLAFGSKRSLFEAALADYLESFVAPLLGPVEDSDAGLGQAAGFFTALGRLFRQPSSQRGCLMINTMAELAGRDQAMTRDAASFAKRYRVAFASALGTGVAAGKMDRDTAARRGEMLANAVMGVWLAVRAEPAAAARSCDAMAAEIRSWDETDFR